MAQPDIFLYDTSLDTDLEDSCLDMGTEDLSAALELFDEEVLIDVEN